MVCARQATRGTVRIAIETEAQAGIVSSKQPGFFRPDDGVTYQETTVMIDRAMNLKLPRRRRRRKRRSPGSSPTRTKLNNDARQSIVAMTKAGLMEGSPVDPKTKKTLYAFNPQAPITRAKRAVILQKIMIQMKKLPK